jgi:hypothetical protein
MTVAESEAPRRLPSARGWAGASGVAPATLAAAGRLPLSADGGLP